MNQNEKPYQVLAWSATGLLILAAVLASFVPQMEYHHWAFIAANSLWVIVGILWNCLLYTSPSPRDRTSWRMPSSA